MYNNNNNLFALVWGIKKRAVIKQLILLWRLAAVIMSCLIMGLQASAEQASGENGASQQTPKLIDPAVQPTLLNIVQLQDIDFHRKTQT